MPEHAIEIRDLHFSYLDPRGRATRVLKGIDLAVERAEVFGLLGPNGAGKSTTFRVLVGLDKPERGEALLNGHAVSIGSREVYHQVGYMPDLGEMFDNSTVEGLLRFFGRCQKMEEGRIERRISELLKQFDLAAQRRSYLRTLSQGGKQQVHLMRCLIHEPAILILDEPASHLDPLRRQLLLDILREERSKGRTIMISSHILPELSEVCTSLALLKDGRVVDKGRVQELKRKHQNPYSTFNVVVASDVSAALNVVSKIGDSNIKGLKRRDAHAFILDYSGTEATTANLLQLMIQAGVRVVEFSRIRKDIEQIYRETVEDWRPE